MGNMASPAVTSSCARRHRGSRAWQMLKVTAERLGGVYVFGLSFTMPAVIALGLLHEPRRTPGHGTAHR